VPLTAIADVREAAVGARVEIHTEAGRLDLCGHGAWVVGARLAELVEARPFAAGDEFLGAGRLLLRAPVHLTVGGFGAAGELVISSDRLEFTPTDPAGSAGVVLHIEARQIAAVSGGEAVEIRAGGDVWRVSGERASEVLAAALAASEMSHGRGGPIAFETWSGDLVRGSLDLKGTLSMTSASIRLLGRRDGRVGWSVVERLRRRGRALELLTSEGARTFSLPTHLADFEALLALYVSADLRSGPLTRDPRDAADEQRVGAIVSPWAVELGDEARGPILLFAPAICAQDKEIARRGWLYLTPSVIVFLPMAGPTAAEPPLLLPVKGRWDWDGDSDSLTIRTHGGLLRLFPTADSSFLKRFRVFADRLRAHEDPTPEVAALRESRRHSVPEDRVLVTRVGHEGEETGGACTTLLDLSIGGCCVSSSVPLRDDEPVSVEIELADGALHLEARKAWSVVADPRGPVWRFGLQFVPMGVDNARRLRDAWLGLSVA